MPAGFWNNSGCSAHAMACSPPIRLVRRRVQQLIVDAEHPRSPHRRQIWLQPRCSTIFSNGTRSPAPHHAASRTSGRTAATSSAVIVWPGRATNSPPAASTNSATHGCEAMIGFPHSSQKTLGLDTVAARSRTAAIAALHRADHALPALPHTHHACDCRDISVNVGERSRRQSKKPHTGLQDFGDRFELIRHRSQHQVRMCGPDLLALRGPGVGDDQARSISDFGTDVRTILSAGYQAVQ